MLRASRLSLMRSSRRLFEDKTFTSSHGKAAIPGDDDSMKGKIVKELKKALKINLILVPIGVFILVVFFPTPTPAQERQMIAEYEKNAGWKT